MSSKKSNGKNEGIEQELTDLYIELCTLESINIPLFEKKLSDAKFTLSDIEFSLRYSRNEVNKNTKNFKVCVLDYKKAKEDLKKCQEEHSKSLNLEGRLHVLLHELEYISKNELENNLLELGKSYEEKKIGHFKDQWLNFRKILKKIAEKEIWQQECKNSILKLETCENQSFIQNIFNTVKKTYKKVWLYDHHVNQRMKTVQLCAQWYAAKGNMINLDSDKKLVEWAEFCKKCSEILERIS